MRESRPTPIGAELSDVMLGAQQKESQTRAVQWRDQQLLQGSGCGALPPFARSKIEKAVASDEIWRNVGWRRVVHPAGGEDHCGRGQGVSLRGRCFRHERRHEPAD